MIRRREALALTATLLIARGAAAGPLAALAPADDARKAIAIGPGGEVYAPDGAGGWVRDPRFATASTLAQAGRAGGSVVALGDGVVYRLADTGWSAIRLVQKGKAVMSSGSRAVAAVGRQLFALDRTVGGEPAKLAVAPADVLAIGSGAKTVVIATELGLYRLDGAAFKRVDRGAPRRGPFRVDRLISDRWALVDRGILDLRSGAVTPWPPGVGVAPTTAIAATDDGLAMVATTRDGLELVTLGGGKLARDPIEGTAGARAVGVVVDKAGRATVALADGRVARRERTWTVAAVRDAVPVAKPGSPPATSP